MKDEQISTIEGSNSPSKNWRSLQPAVSHRVRINQKSKIIGRKPSPVQVRVSPERSVSNDARKKSNEDISRQKAIVEHLEKQVELSR